MTDLISRSDEILGGTPVFAGTRVPVQTLFDYLEAGETLDEFLDDFPAVTKDHAIKVLETIKAHSWRKNMRVLLDECVPRKLRQELTEHVVATVT